MYRLLETDKAYLAGLVDGEGSIIIRKNLGNGNIRGLSLIVQVALSNLEVLEWAKTLYGGTINVYKDKRDVDWKDIAHWHISSRQAMALLLDIKPYMHVKADEAQIAIEFQGSKSSRRTRGLTDEEVALETSQRDLLKSLKRRGIVYEPV